MNSVLPRLRFGFSFYLGISAILHLILFMGVSLLPFMPMEPDVRDTVPARVRFQDPMQESLFSELLPEYLAVNSISNPVEENPGNREVSGLPASFRNSPHPRAYVKQDISDYADIPEPEELAPEFRPPKTQQLPEQLQQIEFKVVEPEPLKRIHSTTASDTDQTSKLMPLNTESVAEDRRQLRNRPSFPYARVRPHLPKKQARLQFELQVGVNGEVRGVKATNRSKVNLDLLRELASWLREWRYESGEGTVKQEVSIEIPGN